MGKFKFSTKASRTMNKVRNAGHKKTTFGTKHVRVTVGTKGIHASIKIGPITYKPGSGKYSIKTPIGGLKYTGKTTNRTMNTRPQTYNYPTNNKFKQSYKQVPNETKVVENTINLKKLIEEYRFNEVNQYIKKHINECAKGIKTEEEICEMKNLIEEYEKLTNKELINNYGGYYKQFQKNRTLTNYMGLYMTYVTMHMREMTKDLPEELQLSYLLQRRILNSDFFMRYCIKDLTHQQLVYQARKLSTRLHLPDFISKDTTRQELKEFILKYYNK